MFEVIEKMLETLITDKPRIQNYIYRDELSRKKQVCKPRKLQRSPKIIGYYREEDDSPEFYTELKLPLLPSIIPEEVERSCNDNTSNKTKVNNVRVKILLTKKEAAELLAKYKAEGNLESIDVVSELVKLPPQRVNVVSISSLCQDTPLSTIPEENEDEVEDEDKEEDEEFFC